MTDVLVVRGLPLFISFLASLVTHYSRLGCLLKYFFARLVCFSTVKQTEDMEHHAVFLFVTVVFCVVHRSGCFNFNLKDVEVFSVQSPKGARDNYFGFTVLLQKGDPPV